MPTVAARCGGTGQARSPGPEYRGRKVSAAVSVRRDVSDSSKGRRDRIHYGPLAQDFVLGIGWRAALSLLG